MCEHKQKPEHNHESEESMLPRLITSIILLVLGFLSPDILWLKPIIFFVAYLIIGYEVLLKAFKNLLKKDVFDENFLMGLATLGALAVGEYPEAVMVMVLYQIGEMLEDMAVEKSKQSISSLMNLRPDYANVKLGDDLVKKSPEDVKIGDIIVVKTGEKIPLDGEIIDGEASVDVSALTGESIPKSLKVGDTALSGGINTNGVLTIRVEKEFGDSTVSKILELVENAASKKPKTANFITKFARYYTPAVVVGALILAILPPLLVNGASFVVWFKRALTFLVISCPCALVISVPLSFFAGIGRASKSGILVKGACYIEPLAKPYAIVFDKTGTLTKGTFSVTNVNVADGVEKQDLLRLAAFAENYSNHPIAHSLKAAYGKAIEPDRISNVVEIAGNGVKVTVDGAEILVGNNKLMEKYSINYNKVLANGSIVYVAKNGKFIGSIVISDELKPDSELAIQKLNSQVKETVMLTGDVKASAEFIAQKLGIRKFYSDLLPAQKVEKLEGIMAYKNGSVIFVGDGINDAPVLTRADVGVAMGGLGSDAAIEAADVVIMDDKILKISEVIKIAKKTMFIVKENIIFAIGVKLLFLILGGMGLITMWGAVFADVGVTLIAILNALRIFSVKKA